MALQSSGPISLGDIQGEFGGSNPISISEYRGSGGTPASGPISFSDFYGKSAWNGSFSHSSYSSLQNVASGACNAIIRVDNNGGVYRGGTNTGLVYIGSWNNGGANTSNTEIRFVVESNNGVGQIFNDASSFVLPSIDREITLAVANQQNGSASGRIEMRPAGGGTIVTADFILSANSGGPGQ